MPYLTLGKASRETGLHKTTIARAIEEGRLSAGRNEHGHYQIDPAELFRVFDPKPREPGVTSDRDLSQPPEQHHATPLVTGTVTEGYLVERVRDLENELDEAREELEDREMRLAELREAMKALPSPESVAAERERLKQEHRVVLEQERSQQNKVLAKEKQRSEQWKEELANRKDEVKKAREEAERISEKAAADIATIERRAASERAIREALESRGFIDRLLNRKPTTAG